MNLGTGEIWGRCGFENTPVGGLGKICRSCENMSQRHDTGGSGEPPAFSELGLFETRCEGTIWMTSFFRSLPCAFSSCLAS